MPQPAAGATQADSIAADRYRKFYFFPPHRYRLKNIDTNQNTILKKSVILFSSHPVNNVVSIAPTVQNTIQAIDNSKIILKFV